MKNIDLILDTDVGSDCDDMAAIAYLVHAKKHLGVNIPAISYSHTSPHGASCIRAAFRDLCESCPPVGIGRIVEGSRDFYCQRVSERFASEDDKVSCESAVRVLRRALAESNGAIICAIGLLTNIAALLESEPDDISELCGVELFSAKCKRLVMMAGDFSHIKGGKRRPEWNVKCDIDSAKTVFNLCEVPIAVLPFETGLDIIAGEPAVKKYGESRAVSLSFLAFGAEAGRHSWDPATLLYAIEGCGEFFEESEPCTLTVCDDGVCDIKHLGGKHKIINMRSDADPTKIKSECAEYIDAAIMKIIEESVRI